MFSRASFSCFWWVGLKGARPRDFGETSVACLYPTYSIKILGVMKIIRLIYDYEKVVSVGKIYDSTTVICTWDSATEAFVT